MSRRAARRTSSGGGGRPLCTRGEAACRPARSGPGDHPAADLYCAPGNAGIAALFVTASWVRLAVWEVGRKRLESRDVGLAQGLFEVANALRREQHPGPARPLRRQLEKRLDQVQTRLRVLETPGFLEALANPR